MLMCADVYGVEEDGSIYATFEIIHMIGWSPHSSQQQPMSRGTAEKSLQNELNTVKPNAGSDDNCNSTG